MRLFGIIENRKNPTLITIATLWHFIGGYFFMFHLRYFFPGDDIFYLFVLNIIHLIYEIKDQIYSNFLDTDNIHRKWYGSFTNSIIDHIFFTLGSVLSFYIYPTNHNTVLSTLLVYPILAIISVITWRYTIEDAINFIIT